MERTFVVTGAYCDKCLAAAGQPVPEQVGMVGKVRMGHQYYHTSTGQVAVCQIVREARQAARHAV